MARDGAGSASNAAMEERPFRPCRLSEGAPIGSGRRPRDRPSVLRPRSRKRQVKRNFVAEAMWVQRKWPCHLFGFEVSIRKTGPMREIQRVGQIAGEERVYARQGERVHTLLFEAGSRPIDPNRLSWIEGNSERNLPGHLESGRPGAQGGVACLTSSIHL